MVKLFAIGELLLDTLTSIGDFLINKNVGELIDQYVDVPIVEDVLDFLAASMSDLSIAELVIGGGLVFILVVRLFRFFVGMFT